MKKFFYILVISILSAAAALALWSISGYLLSMKDKTAPQLPDEVTLNTAAGYQLGSNVDVQCEIKLPRYRKVLNCLLTPGEGTVVSASPAAKVIKHSWRYNTWRISGTVTCIRPGVSRSGVMAIELSPLENSQQKSAFTLAIPAITIKELPAVPDPVPQLAPESAAAKKWSKKWHFLWLLLLIIPLLLWIFRKKSQPEKKIPLHKRTLDALALLRADVISKNVSAESGIIRLTDVIRFYLEQRYSLPDSGKTTPEFLEDMENNSTLPESDRPFLQHFLNAADLIKFAKAPCDASAVNNAIDSAEKLVTNTAMPEEDKNV
ncbi:MAG: hypothetical protein IKA87_08720 [Lentisphaeria bacterium]|nr:hypothetical protein [Lentisphaeria bacterium]